MKKASKKSRKSKARKQRRASLLVILIFVVCAFIWTLCPDAVGNDLVTSVFYIHAWLCRIKKLCRKLLKQSKKNG